MTPLISSLQSAAMLVVRQPGYVSGSINLERWAETYRCSPSDVEDALKLAENGGRKLPEETAVSSSKAIPSTEVDE
jgi:hypothetical protein